jgi:hypothetical protein
MTFLYIKSASPITDWRYRNHLELQCVDMNRDTPQKCRYGTKTTKNFRRTVIFCGVSQLKEVSDWRTVFVKSMLEDEERGALSSGANVAPASDDNDEALPIVSQVEPPKELLDRVRELEEKHQNLPSAVPVDQEEVNKRQKSQRRR